MCVSPQRRTNFRHLNFKKCSETDVFCTFWLHNVLFATAACNFSTSELQKAPSTSCFVHFHVQMCFSPQRRAIFRHLNFKKCSEHLMFCAFSRPNVLFATAACNFWFRTRRFHRPTFRLTRHTNPRENTAFRDFSNIWRGCIFFLLTFALLHLLSADLTTLLCFSTVHIVGSFYLNFLRLNMVVFQPAMLVYQRFWLFFWNVSLVGFRYL